MSQTKPSVKSKEKVTVAALKLQIQVYLEIQQLLHPTSASSGYEIVNVRWNKLQNLHHVTM